MKIIVWNIQYGVGLDGVLNLERTISSLKNYDIVCLNEIDRFTERSTYRDQYKEICDALSFDYNFYTPAYSYLNNRERESSTGNAIFSKLPIAFSVNHSLPHFLHNGYEYFMQSMIECFIEFTSTSTIQFMLTHLTPLHPSYQLKQLEYVVSKIRPSGSKITLPPIKGLESKVEKRVLGTFLAGDMNFNTTSEPYNFICGPTNKVLGRLSSSYKLNDLFDRDEFTGIETSLEFGKIDHVFVSESIFKFFTKGQILELNGYSDHRALTMEINI